MQAKRSTKPDPDSSDDDTKVRIGISASRSASATPSPQKKTRAMKGEGRTPWTKEEELRFLEVIDKLHKAGLWAEVKGDEKLSRRGANGVRAHWDALVHQYKKMKNAA